MATVLVIDDAAFMRASLKKMLESNGFAVVGEASDGKIGVSKYRELNPDLVTLDITMPEMTGIEALKEIRKYDSKAKVVMVTAVGQEGLVKEAVINGAKSFVVKPFKEEQLIKTLQKVSQT